VFDGLEVHKREIQVWALDEAGLVQREFQIETTPEAIDRVAAPLGPADAGVLEAPCHTWAIWARRVGRAGRVVVANPLAVTAIAPVRIKTDTIDARTLVHLLRAARVREVVMPDEATWELRQLTAHRQILGKRLVAVKNTLRGVLNKRLLVCPHADLFNAVGRQWVVHQPVFTETERQSVTSALAVHEALTAQRRMLDERLRARAGHLPAAKLLRTIPGVTVTVALGLVAALGDSHRFPTPGKRAAYFGLVPSTYQSGEQCYHGGITTGGRSQARWLAIEAAQSLALSGAPLSATYHRVRRKKGHNVAVTALARKLVVLVWHLLRKEEPSRSAPVARTRHTLRRVSSAARPAAAGQVPTTLEAVYAEADLPALTARPAAEKRGAAINRRTLTRLRRTSPAPSTESHSAGPRSPEFARIYEGPDRIT
jgi:transposase